MVVSTAMAPGRRSRRGEDRIQNPLILGPLFWLVADRCDDLRFRRSRSLDGCGHLVLFRRYLVSEKYPSDHGCVCFKWWSFRAVPSAW